MKLSWCMAGMLILTLAGTPASAQSLFGNWGAPAPSIDLGDKITGPEALALVSILDSKTWDLKTTSVSDIVAKIPVSARYALYERYKTAGAWGILNIYGVGSFIQGDPATSLVTIGGFAVGLTLAGNLARLPEGPDRSIWTGAGFAVAAGGLIYGLVRPWFFADEKNRSLRTFLLAAE